jgi:protoporphyrinogen oxidase
MEFVHRSTDRTTAVIGGGILGMTIALRLAQRGERVRLFEAADHLGGLADAWKLGDVRWDRHYHVTLMSDTFTRSLLSELDLDDDMRWVETKTGFFVDGNMYSMSNSVEFLKFPPLSLLAKFRLGGTIFLGSKIRNWKKLERIPVGDWLRRWSGREAFNRMWLPLLKAKLGDNYKHTSAAFIWATIARMYAARRTGLKKEMFGYLPGGYARMLDAFESYLAEAGVEIRTSTPIHRVNGADNGGPAEVVFPNGKTETFDRIVLTCPSPLISRMCPDLSQDEHARHNGLRYQGIVCASVLLKKPLDRYYVTNITDDSIPFTAVIEMSALVDRKEFGGQSLIYLPKYVAPDDPLFAVSDEEIQERFVAALERMYPHFERGDVTAFRISRVRHVVALSTLKYSKQLPPMRTSLPGVFAVNSSQIVNGTLNVNETIKLAEEAVAGVLNEVSETSEFDHSQKRPTHAPPRRELVARS